MTEYPEYNPLDDHELLPIEEEKKITLTEAYYSGHESVYFDKLNELKEDFKQVADQLKDRGNGWGEILTRIIEKL